MWWKKKPEPPLREQLVEACTKVRRQISIINAGPVDSNMRFSPGVMVELQARLAELEQALADLDRA